MYYYVNWSFVKSFGNLQILTRASYFVIVFVPILAALWPIVRIIINNLRHHLMIEQISMQSKVVEMNESLEQDRTDVSTPNNILDLLRDELGTLVPPEIPYQSADLPELFAIAYLASLFSVIGHLIYQLFAPESVKFFSESRYIQEQIRIYCDNPTIGFLSDLNYYSLKTNGDSRDLDRTMKLATDFAEKYPDSGDKLLSPVLLDFVREKLSEKYRFFSGKFFFWSLLSASLYICSVLLIFWIISDQAQSVFIQSGW